MKSRLSVILLFTISYAYCQTPEITNSCVLSGGAGMYASGDYRGLSFYSSLNWIQFKTIERDYLTYHRNTILKFRYTKNIASTDEDHYENLNEFGLLYGKSFGKTVQFKISGGIGLLTGTKPAGYVLNPIGPSVLIDKSFLTPAVPLEMGITIALSKYFGTSVTGYANLNPSATFIGTVITLEFGKLYPAK